MQAEDNTYVRLFRKSMDSQVYKNPELWHLWTHLLMTATYKERWVNVDTGHGVTQIRLRPGQLICGRHSLAKELGQKPSSIRYRLEKLKKCGNVDIHSGTHYSLITVVNWEVYQGNGEKVDSHLDNHMTGIGQPYDTNNKGNKGKKVKNKTYGCDFEQFWSLYPKKVNKVDAYREWKKLDPDETTLKTILEKLSVQRGTEGWTKEGGKYIPHPMRYISKRRWEDELPEADLNRARAEQLMRELIDD